MSICLALQQLLECCIIIVDLTPLFHQLLVFLDPLQQRLGLRVVRKAIRQCIPNLRVCTLRIDGTTAHSRILRPQESSRTLYHDSHLIFQNFPRLALLDAHLIHIGIRESTVWCVTTLETAAAGLEIVASSETFTVKASQEFRGRVSVEVGQAEGV